MFRRSKRIQIAGNRATVEASVDEYRIIVTIERQGARAISEDDAERALTRAKQQIFQIEAYSSGGVSRKA